MNIRKHVDIYCAATPGQAEAQTRCFVRLPGWKPRSRLLRPTGAVLPTVKSSASGFRTRMANALGNAGAAGVTRPRLSASAVGGNQRAGGHALVRPMALAVKLQLNSCHGNENEPSALGRGTGCCQSALSVGLKFSGPCGGNQRGRTSLKISTF